MPIIGIRDEPPFQKGIGTTPDVHPELLKPVGPETFQNLSKPFPNPPKTYRGVVVGVFWVGFGGFCCCYSAYSFFASTLCLGMHCMLFIDVHRCSLFPTAIRYFVATLP